MTPVENLFITGPAGQLAVRTKGLEAQPKEILVLMQASNLTGQTMYDFQFGQDSSYSLMDAMCGMGFGAVTFSLRGYGLSTAPPDPFSVTTEAGMEDLSAVMTWLAGRGFEKPHLLGFSWGGRIAGRYAETHAEGIDRLILYDPARGGGNPVLPAPTDPWWTNTYENYAEKLEPDFTDAAFRKALGEYVAANEARSPNGIRMENAKPVIAVDPTRITRPTLLVYGVEAAKAAYMQGGLSRSDFFEALATDDKTFTILPGSGDFTHFQRTRGRLHKAIRDFLVPS